MGALAAKIEGAARAQMMSEQMKNTVPALTKAIEQMEAMGIAGSVAEFEKVFEDMDVKVAEIDQAMDSVTASSCDPAAVEALLGEISDQHAMGAGGQLAGQNVGMGAIANPNAQKEANEVDDFEARMNALNQL